MWINQITAEDVCKRAHVHKLAPTNPYAALIVAQSIPHPWYRCQSLSNVAEYIKDTERRLIVLDEAFKVAQTQEEINRIVTVSSWPLEVLASISLEKAKKCLDRLLSQAQKEMHPIRRTDAIFSLTMAVINFPSLLEIIIPVLVKSTLDGHGWKIDRLIRFLVPMLLEKNIFMEMIDPLIAHHREDRRKRRFLACLNHIHPNN